jgi:CRP/FNR family transcriptional regulator, cyclic AMP receptor protein
MLFHPVFRILDDSSRAALERRTRLLTLKKGETLVAAQQTCRDCYVVVSGKLRIDSGEDETKATTGFLNVLDIYVEELREPYFVAQNSLVAVLHTTVQAIPLDALRHSLETNPQLLLQSVDLVNSRVQSLRKQLRRLNTQEAEVVIGRALYELSDEGPGGSRIVNKRITQAALASYVGMSREQVNKKMRELEAKGLIRRVEDGFELDASFAHTRNLIDHL